ncbi:MULTISPECIES: GNAT family N-acetyltransferase [Micromonospora]|uniref:Acetyltransferase n=1 Tax=Micromonospora gifhornensis TaxID=84594 RepID=A0ABQ4IES3_9ACTN|nr:MULTISPECIES: GNAT family protein [Micromonospora]AEB43961.1 GCN5-related N-acetyltransferase [Micromonospora maris AB-18-032]GIJ16382.1 acetyltransferase [Micromonospora gifhornensis]
MVNLTGPGLLLRPWQEGDAPAALDAFGDPEIALWNPQGDGLDLDAARQWVRRRADWSNGTNVALALADPTDPAVLLGSVSLHRIHDGDASIGYWVVPAARGRGLASAAVARVTAWAFAELGLHRIELCHAVGNPASCRVAERAGYLAEGTLRQSHRYGDGRRHDEHLHARLATD